MPVLAAAITSGTDTPTDAKTQSDDAAEHVGSEKVAFSMIESSASVNTVALKSSHAIPAIPSDTATTGVRVGLGVAFATLTFSDTDAAEPKIAVFVLSGGVAVAGPNAPAALAPSALAAMEPYE